MAFEIVTADTATTNASLASPMAINLPANIASGDHLVVLVARDDTQTFTWPAGWTELIDSQLNAKTTAVTVGVRKADGTEGATVSVTSSFAAAADTIAIALRVTDAHATSLPEAAGADGNGANDPPSLTPSWGAEENIWIAVATARGGAAGACSYPASYTLSQVSLTANTQADLQIGARLLSAASEDPAAFGTENFFSGDYHAITIAVRPGAAAPVDTGAFFAMF